MGTLILNEMKKRASGFLHEKYRTARLVLTDVTPAELLAEEATNNDPCSPDAKTMTRITKASFDIEDYWRIVDVLHGRFYSLDWKQWRQAYKALVLLEFLLTHGPEDFAEEFLCDVEVIRELGTFKHVDEKGFNWGACMQKKSERILKLLNGGEFFREARLKALKITKEIKGFGSLTVSPTSSPSSSSSTPTSFTTSPGAPRASFSSSSMNGSSPSWKESDGFNFNKHEQYEPKKELIDAYSYDELLKDKSSITFHDGLNDNLKKLHLWDCHTEESGSLLNTQNEKREAGGVKDPRYGFLEGIRSRLGSPSNLRSFSDVGMVMKKKLDRQFSMGY